LVLIPGIAAEEHAVVKRIFQAVLMVAAVLVFVPHQSADAATCRPALKGVAVSPTSVPGGANVTVKVTLTCDAPTTVSVHLQGFKGVTTPSVVLVARRRDTGTATIKTSVTHLVRRGEIEATLGRVHRKAALTVTRTPRTCRTPVLAGFSTPSLVYVGNRIAATIRLSCASATSIRASLSSSNRTFLPVPGKITIGRYYNTATISLVPKADQEGQYKATVTVRYGSRSMSRTITVDPGLASVSIPPCSEPNCVFPDVLFTGIIPAGGFTVRLASSNPAITVPATAPFAAGSLGGGFTGVTVQPVTKTTSVTISATFGGRTLRATTVLLPPWNTSDRVTLSAEAGSGPIYGQEFTLEYIVLLSNPAPASGETVSFSASDSSIELQSTSTFIAPGNDDGYLDINTANVTSAVHAQIDATVQGVKASLPVTIEPGLASITGLPATIVGGNGFTAMVNLAGPVDTATTVNLQSTAGILTVPLQVVIPAGQSSASFKATTVPVTADSGVSIIASLGNTNLQSGTVTLTP
jgi:hypothetical protein